MRDGLAREIKQLKEKNILLERQLKAITFTLSRKIPDFEDDYRANLRAL